MSSSPERSSDASTQHDYKANWFNAGTDAVFIVAESPCIGTYIFIVIEGTRAAARLSYSTGVTLANEWHRGLDMFYELVIERALATMLVECAVSTELVPVSSSNTATYYPMIWTLPPLPRPAPAELMRLYQELEDIDDAI